MNARPFAIIVPVQNEAAIIGATLDELRSELPADCLVAVGLNGCSDGSREICAQRGVIIGETERSGYGWGCQAAIDAVEKECTPAAYLFYAGDGANTPGDLVKLIRAHVDGRGNFIIGLREFRLQNWFHEFGRALPNLLLGISCALLGGQFFHDLGPMRLIERDLFRRMRLREMVWGWTIEAQIRAAQLGARIAPIEISERPRQGGEQKVSGVSLRRSSRIGWEIFRAALRTSRSHPDVP